MKVFIFNFALLQTSVSGLISQLNTAYRFSHSFPDILIETICHRIRKHISSSSKWNTFYSMLMIMWDKYIDSMSDREVWTCDGFKALIRIQNPNLASIYYSRVQQPPMPLVGQSFTQQEGLWFHMVQVQYYHNWLKLSLTIQLSKLITEWS